jgi:sec-independent protein translocase protein TatC
VEQLKSNIQKFLPYLEDLQRRLYFSTITIIVVFFVGFLSSGFILKKLIANFKIDAVVLATTSPFQFANIAIDIGIFCALIVALPLFMYHFFSFSYSALTKKELRKLLLSIPVSFILFLVGFLYGFFILFYSFSLLASVNQSIGIQNIWDISLFLSQMAITSALLGFVFQMPLVLTLLIKMGVISVSFLKSKRRLVVLLLCILVALLPPTDGLSLIAMALPLYFLYELTILINFKK